MIYVTGPNGLIGKSLSEKIDIFPISFREEEPKIIFESNSILIHLSSSINTRNTISSFEDSFRDDICIPLKIFKNYLDKNPKGKIIFLSSSGDLHSQNTFSEKSSNEQSPIDPKSLYGTHKILMENYLKLLHDEYEEYTSIVFRVSNVYGGKPNKHRTNGLIDKLLNFDDIIEIYSDLKNTINIIHVNDLIDLIVKSISKEMDPGHYMFLVGHENHTIQDIISIICSFKKLNLILKPNNQKNTHINLNCDKVQEYFSWSCNKSLIDMSKSL